MMKILRLLSDCVSIPTRILQHQSKGSLVALGASVELPNVREGVIFVRREMYRLSWCLRYGLSHKLSESNDHYSPSKPDRGLISDNRVNPLATFDINIKPPSPSLTICIRGGRPIPLTSARIVVTKSRSYTHPSLRQKALCDGRWNLTFSYQWCKWCTMWYPSIVNPTHSPKPAVQCYMTNKVLWFDDNHNASSNSHLHAKCVSSLETAWWTSKWVVNMLPVEFGSTLGANGGDQSLLVEISGLCRFLHEHWKLYSTLNGVRTKSDQSPSYCRVRLQPRRRPLCWSNVRHQSTTKEPGVSPDDTT